MKELQTTLLFLFKGKQILLAEKKRGYGVGKYNGIGGKLESGETVEQAMIRETQEEIVVTPIHYVKRGVIKFDEYRDGEPIIIRVHVFTADAFTGEPQETEEMCPVWVDVDKIPLERMYATDQLWLPIILENRGYFEATFKFDKANNLVDQKIEIISTSK